MAGEASALVHDLLPFASHVHVAEAPLAGCKPRSMRTRSTFRYAGWPESFTLWCFLALNSWVAGGVGNRTDNVSETVCLRRALESTASMLTA